MAVGVMLGIGLRLSKAISPSSFKTVTNTSQKGKWTVSGYQERFGQLSLL